MKYQLRIKTGPGNYFVPIEFITEDEGLAISLGEYAAVYFGEVYRGCEINLIRQEWNTLANYVPKGETE